MKLSLADVLDNLLVGEFSLMSWAEKGSFSIPEANKIIVLLNAAMGEISSRFWIKRKQVHLQLCKGKNVYVIDKSVANQQAKLKGQCYLFAPNGEMFEDDLIEIYKVMDCNGMEFPLNSDAPNLGKSTCSRCNRTPCGCQNTLDTPGTIVTRHSPFGCNDQVAMLGFPLRLQSYNTLVVPNEVKRQRLVIEYRSGAKRLKPVVDDGLYDPSRIYLDLPYEYLQALIFYIASRKFNPNMNGLQQGFHEGNNYYQKYIAACALLQDQGSGVEPVGNAGEKFSARGFV